MGSRTSRGMAQPLRRRAITVNIARCFSLPGTDHTFCFLRFVPTHKDRIITADFFIVFPQQALQQKAAKIAATYTVDKNSWVQAAAELRQPYWDWARPQGPVPPEEIISMPQVQIIKPNGVQTFVDNPFLGFTFPSEDSRASFDGDFQIWPKTLRNPDGEGEDAASSVESLKELVMIHFFLGDLTLTLSRV
jgi:hypothetical protein